MKANPQVCYIGLGSNMGDRLSLCEEAMAHLGRLPRTWLCRRSSWYETEPVVERPLPAESQAPGWFFNGVVELETMLRPIELFHACLEIERRMGRVRSPSVPMPSFSRPIDLDLLLYGATILATPELAIPHPRFHQRRFVLIPLAELAPDLLHPTLQQTINALLERLTDSHKVTQVASATRVA